MSEEAVDLAGGIPALHPERKGVLNISPKKNWVEKSGGLPAYINSVATALIRERGYTRSRAIATAVNWAKTVCATGRAFGGRVKVSAAVQAAACSAVASWERKKAGSVDLTEISDQEFFGLLGLEWHDGEDSDEGFDYEAHVESTREEADLTDYKLQMPLDFAEGTKIGRRTWRKRILPFGTINYGGKKYTFDRDWAEKVIANFRNGAFDQVPLVLADPENRHNESPENFVGEVKSLELSEDGIEATVETTDRGTKLLEDNPKLGTSPRLFTNYVRGADQKVFGPVIRHLAATMRPHVFGNSSEWQPVDLTEPEGETVDLTSAVVEAESVGGGENVSKEESVENVEQNVLNLTAEEVAELRTNAQKALDLAESERTKREQLETRLREERVETELRGYAEAGVPPAAIDLARPILLGRDKGENGEMVDLTDEDAASKTRELLELYKGMVPRGEAGTVDLTSEKDEDEAALEYLRQQFGN